jgi:hypothetical protein
MSVCIIKGDPAAPKIDRFIAALVHITLYTSKSRTTEYIINPVKSALPVAGWHKRSWAVILNLQTRLCCFLSGF